MEKITDVQLKREMVFHLYGRFAPIRDIIEKNRKGKKKLKILDVGGRGNLMKNFFPEDDVFYLDPNIDSNDENFIKGDGCAMPLDDESFNWVVSTDVFEHISKERREKFLEENLRVANLGVILVAPFYTEEVEQAEINANENYKTLHGGVDHLWLKEHIENVLPEMEVIETFLNKKNILFQKLFNNNLFLWQLLMGIEFLFYENADESVVKVAENFNYFYNTEVYPVDNQEPSYRKIYFIKKDKELENIEITHDSIKSALFLKTIKESLNLVSSIDVKNKSLISQGIKAVSSFDMLAQQKDEEIASLNVLSQQKDEEIAFMKSSKFWMMRKNYISLKDKLKL